VSAVVRRPRLAIVSPFLDKRHGTERRVVEWISQLAGSFEIHVYSQRIEDVDLSTITWHRIPKLPGPHLINFVWWLAANRVWREWDRRVRGLRHDLTFSPGINCLDADAMTVHIVFAEYLHRNYPHLTFEQNRWASWARLLHRRLYYSFVIALERRAYMRPDVILIPIAQRIGEELGRFYGRHDRFRILYAGLDHGVFNPERRAALREKARKQLGLTEENFALLLIGNDWRNKGLPALISALAQLQGRPIHLLAAGEEDPAAYQTALCNNAIETQVHFLAPRRDVEFYYASADAYAGPSLEDAFGLPFLEAMACGLPVIVSAAAGASEIITDGADGLILKDPTDSSALAATIRRLYEDRDFRFRLGEKAAETARQYTWERNGRDLTAIFEEILRRKSQLAGQTAPQES
jgi:UDP-glucose:(heptosyl)LPS alpha-1,3-glucosyltransferase